MKTNSKKIGIVSGVGPLAGSDLLNKLFKNAALSYQAVEDCEYPDVILINHGIEGVDSSGALNDNFEKEIIGMVHQLENNGANVIGIACNTAHLYLDKIKTKPETTLVNLIDTVSEVASYKSANYLLLTSETSKQQKLYHSYLEKYGVSFAETTPELQQLADQAIGLVMGYKLDQAGQLLDQVLKAAASKYDAVIAGCTELPIAVACSQNPHKLPVIDSNDELAKALLKNYYGH